MPLDDLAAPGIIGILIIQIGTVLTAAVRTYRNGKKPPGPMTISEMAGQCADWHTRVETTLARMAQETHEMHQLHDVRDSDNVPVWYVRKSLEKGIGDLITLIDRQNILLQKLYDKIDELGNHD